MPRTDARLEKMMTDHKDLEEILKEKQLNLDEEIRVHLRRAIKECIYSREEIAERMSSLTGKSITKAQLDSWTAESKRAHHFPAAYLPAFVMACGVGEIMEFLCQRSGGRFIKPHELKKELFEIEKNVQKLDIRRKEILQYLLHLEVDNK